MSSIDFDHGRRSRVMQVPLILLAIITGVIGTVAAFPPQGTERKIVSDDFTKNRQEGASTASSSKGQSSANRSSKPKSRRTYRLVSEPRTRPLSASTGNEVAQLGITIWRLRPLTANDS